MVFISQKYHVFILVDSALRFANYYQDHMVLQRAPQRAIVWGYSRCVSMHLLVLTMDNKMYRTTNLCNQPTNSIGALYVVSDIGTAQPEEGPFQVHVTQPLSLMEHWKP